MISNTINRWMFLAVTGLSGWVYWLTACRSVGYNDSGELAANCFFYSIPHPTGYPLYVNLGRLAAIFLPGSIVFRCTLLSLFSTALASGILFLLMLRIPLKIKSNFVRLTAAAAAALFTAFSPTWWAQATVNEVYSLTLFLNTLVVLLFVLYHQGKESKFLLIGFYCWGLSFTVHMSSLYLCIAIVYICFITDNWKGLLGTKYLYALCFFILPLTFYAYLPIRSSQAPFLNWSVTSDWHGFINHISGWQYSALMFQSVSTMFDGVKFFGLLLYKQFGILGIFLMGFGAISLIRYHLKMTVFLSLIILADIIYSSNYGISDIESYYLIAYMCLSIFCFGGIMAIYILMEKIISQTNKMIILKIIIVIIICCLPLSNLINNYSRQDFHRWNLASAGVNNLLQSVQPNSIAFIQYWDFNSPWLYLHNVEGIRPDVTFIQQDLLGCSWYLKYIQRKYPDIVEGSEILVEDLKVSLISYESSKNTNIHAITSKHNNLINSLIRQNMRKRSIYIDFASSQTFDFKFQKIPVGGLYKLEEFANYIPYDINCIDISAWESAGNLLDVRALGALDCVYGIVKARIDYCNQLGYPEEAKEYLKLASRIETLFRSSGL